MPKPDITKPNTVESFVKANSTLRVSSDAITQFILQLNTLSETVVKAAETHAKQEDRTTIMANDVNTAMASVIGSATDLPSLFKQIERLNAKDTANLSMMIQKWLETH